MTAEIVLAMNALKLKPKARKSVRKMKVCQGTEPRVNRMDDLMWVTETPPRRNLCWSNHLLAIIIFK